MEIKVSALGYNYRNVSIIYAQVKQKKYKKTQWKSVSNGNQIITLIAVTGKLFQSLSSLVSGLKTNHLIVWLKSPDLSPQTLGSGRSKNHETKGWRLADTQMYCELLFVHLTAWYSQLLIALFFQVSALLFIPHCYVIHLCLEMRCKRLFIA